MYKEKAQEISFTYIDPDRNEKMAMSLEEEIVKLISETIRKEEAIWESIVSELEQKIVFMEKRARIIQLTNRRFLKRAL